LRLLVNRLNTFLSCLCGSELEEDVFRGTIFLSCLCGSEQLRF